MYTFVTNFHLLMIAEAVTGIARVLSSTTSLLMVCAIYPTSERGTTEIPPPTHAYGLLLALSLFVVRWGPGIAAVGAWRWLPTRPCDALLFQWSGTKVAPFGAQVGLLVIAGCRRMPSPVVASSICPVTG